MASRFRTQFPLMSKVEVNGPDAHPVFAWLKQHTPAMHGEAARRAWSVRAAGAAGLAHMAARVRHCSLAYRRVRAAPLPPPRT